MLQFDALGFLGIIAVLMCWSLAAVLYRIQSPGGLARMVAVLLLVEGVTLLSTGYVDMFFTEALQSHPGYASWVFAEAVIHTLGDCAMLVLYPPFLAMVLQTRLTRPFSSSKMRVFLALGSLALFGAVVLSPLEVGATLLYVMLSLLFAYALIASIHAWRAADPGAARARAGCFALAFGFRDVSWGFVYAGAIWLIFAEKYAITETKADDPTQILSPLFMLSGRCFTCR